MRTGYPTIDGSSEHARRRAAVAPPRNERIGQSDHDAGRLCGRSLRPGSDPRYNGGVHGVRRRVETKPSGRLAGGLGVDLAHRPPPGRTCRSSCWCGFDCGRGRPEARVEDDADESIEEPRLVERPPRDAGSSPPSMATAKPAWACTPGPPCRDGQAHWPSSSVRPSTGQAADHHLTDPVHVDVIAEGEATQQRLRHGRLAGGQLAGDDVHRAPDCSPAQCTRPGGMAPWRWDLCDRVGAGRARIHRSGWDLGEPAVAFRAAVAELRAVGPGRPRLLRSTTARRATSSTSRTSSTRRSSWRPSL